MIVINVANPRNRPSTISNRSTGLVTIVWMDRLRTSVGMLNPARSIAKSSVNGVINV